MIIPVEPVWTNLWEGRASNPAGKPEGDLLQLWRSGIRCVVVIASCLLLFSIVDLVAEDRQRYMYGSIGVGALGTPFFFSILPLQELREEPMLAFFGATPIVTLMFVPMNISGFRAK